MRDIEDWYVRAIPKNSKNFQMIDKKKEKDTR